MLFVAQTFNQGAETLATVVLGVSIAWVVFVFFWMVTIASHLGAIRRKMAPQPEPIVWEEAGEKYAMGFYVLTPMYGVWDKKRPVFPLAVFPFTDYGRTDAIQKLRTLEAAVPPSSGPQLSEG